MQNLRKNNLSTNNGQVSSYNPDLDVIDGLKHFNYDLSRPPIEKYVCYLNNKGQVRNLTQTIKRPKK